MLSAQTIFDNASSYLRSYGNPYGSYPNRGWGWINPDNQGERCAIASFLPDCKSDLEITAYLNHKVFACQKELTYLINEITRLFDYDADVCNDKELLEERLAKIAREYNLVYSNPNVSESIQQIKEKVLTNV